jgi:succinate dehydrogenase flavin-adding protein (antitoxin of CptAB toxin-antitoxin module)
MVFLTQKPIYQLNQQQIIDKMSGKSQTEKACTLSWFHNWNQDQKQKFGQILLEKDKEVLSLSSSVDDESLNSLMATLGEMSLKSSSKNHQEEGPSIFDCQLKIFSKWFNSWSPADRSDFATQLNAQDHDFVTMINSLIGYK